MRVALVALGHPQGPYDLEQIATGLARRGIQVEVFVHQAGPVLALDGSDRVVVRRFRGALGGARFTGAPGLIEQLRANGRSLDVVHVHGAHPGLSLAVGRATPMRLVFTPRAPLARMLRWPDSRVTRAVVDAAVQVVCLSHSEADLLRRSFPRAEGRILSIPDGVDVDAIRAGRPFERNGQVVLVVGRLERYRRVARAISAMAGLDPSFRLVVLGEGPARRRLETHAADQGVSARVRFVGSVSRPELYRWLRTACVVVCPSEHEASGLQLLEALSAGVHVVASDIPPHREAVSQTDEEGVILVSPEGSPLEVEEAIREAAESPVGEVAQAQMPSWESAVDRTLDLYLSLVRRPRQAPPASPQPGPDEAVKA